jgi:hypothetical protein
MPATKSCERSADATSSCDSATDNFPNRLAAPTPETQAVAWRPWVLAALLLLWLVPRLLMAGKIDIICSDGAFYVESAKNLENIDPQNKLPAELFNLYPHTLVSLHGVGFDWETAAKFWGVLCGTLTVLPLFGWIRRQFNDRTAIVACVLLAVHPKLVEWCPEMVRDPTFCLLLCLAIYCSWRAACEVRPMFFLLAGVVTVLAMQIRFEGWFLLIPLGLWSFWRMLALTVGRLRLVGGATAFVCAFPLVMLALNFGFGEHYSSWIWGSSLHRLLYLQHWKTAKPSVAKVSSKRARTSEVQTAVFQSSTPGGERFNVIQTAAQEPIAPVARTEVAPPLERQMHMSNRWASWLTLRTIARGFTPIHGLLTLLGLIVGRRLWLRRDHQPMFYFFLAVAAGMWLHTWEAKASSSRYALSLVLVSAPFTALGLLALGQRLSSVFQSAAEKSANVSPAFSFRLTAGLLVLTSVVCCSDTLLGSEKNRQSRYSLGTWILQEFGPGQQIAGPKSLNLTGYYAQSKYLALNNEPLSVVVEESQPDVFVLAKGGVAAEHLKLAVANLTELQYRVIDNSRLPEVCRYEVVVLVRPLLQARSEGDTNQR